MKVAHGYKGKHDCDVDLWGCERLFPLNDIEKKMDEDLTAINQLKCASRYGNTIEKLQVTERTLLIMSQGFQRMRTQLMAKYALETRLQNMKSRNPDKKDSFQYSLGFIYHNTTELEHALKRTFGFVVFLYAI